MKRAIIYSLIFHILIFSFLTIFQKSTKISKLEPEIFSILILPPQQKFYEKKDIIRKPPTLRKSPPIKNAKQPQKLSSIPKRDNYASSTKQENINREIHLERKRENETFKNIKPFERTDKGPDIFDKDVISKLTDNKKINKENYSSQLLSFSSKEFNDWGYLQRLKEKIERVWQYPIEAAERGIFGDLYIKFIIDKKGKLISIELLRTSGYRMLDDAAIKALKDAQPFWPLPDDWEKDSLTITGHFIYTLRGFYLR